MKTHFLPKKLKRELRKIWGIPIFGNKKEVAKKFRKILEKKKFSKIITVGDYCSLNLPSDVKIFDGKIKKKKIKNRLPYSLKCGNPPGTIQKEVWPVIKKTIKEKKNLFVNGEEDLLVIPAVLVAGKKNLVVYGFSKKGVCALETSAKMKKDLRNLLKRFKTA